MSVEQRKELLRKTCERLRLKIVIDYSSSFKPIEVECLDHGHRRRLVFKEFIDSPNCPDCGSLPSSDRIAGYLKKNEIEFETDVEIEDEKFDFGIELNDILYLITCNPEDDREVPDPWVLVKVSPDITEDELLNKLQAKKNELDKKKGIVVIPPAALELMPSTTLKVGDKICELILIGTSGASYMTPEFTPIPLHTLCAVGYVRVSTDRQVQEGCSISAQTETIYEVAKRKAFYLRRIYLDLGISGSELDNRAGLMKLLEELRAREKVIVSRLDRLSRDTRHMMNLEFEITNRKAALILGDLDIDTTSPVGRVGFQIMASFAQYERQLIRDRTSQTMRHMSANGMLRGKPPFGFRYQGKNMPFIPDPDEQKVLTRIREIKALHPHLTVTELAIQLEKEGLKCRKCKRWYPATLFRILRANGIILSERDDHERKIAYDKEP